MKINVSFVEKLANLTLREPEEKKFEKQLSEIIVYVNQLNSVETDAVSPTSQVTGLENVSREDQTVACLPQEKVLQNTRSKQNGLFKVKGILEE